MIHIVSPLSYLPSSMSACRLAVHLVRKIRRQMRKPPNFVLDAHTVVTGMIRAKIIRRPLREAISRGFQALREIRAKGG